VNGCYFCQSGRAGVLRIYYTIKNIHFASLLKKKKGGGKTHFGRKAVTRGLRERVATKQQREKDNKTDHGERKFITRNVMGRG